MGLHCFLSPPHELVAEKVCEWLPLVGWIASDLPFTGIQLVSRHVKEDLFELAPKLDTANLPPELAGKFIRTFKSRIPVKEMIGEEEAGIIIVKALLEGGGHDLARIDMPRYRFRKEKEAKRSRFSHLLACPFCRQALDPAPPATACRQCGRTFPWTGNSRNFLEGGLKEEFAIVPSHNVSENGVIDSFQEILAANPDRIFLDVGAGFKSFFLPNLINLEVVDYPSTDVLGVGERLPFLSESMDGIYCDCVLEHVKDPFACAREILRVLKPGGFLHCTVPFLQPVHAYPNHFYNMTLQGLINLFPGMEVRETLVPEHLHPMVSISWILKSYLVWLPEAEKRRLAEMTVLELLETFPMGGGSPDHPIRRALPKEKWPELCSGNTLVAVKPGAPCNLRGVLDPPAGRA